MPTSADHPSHGDLGILAPDRARLNEKSVAPMGKTGFIVQLWHVMAMATSYNWLFLWDYTFYKWGYKHTKNY